MMQVQLPRWKLESSSELSEELKKLGMRDAFSEAANFQRMAPNEDLSIAKVIHKAFIEVGLALLIPINTAMLSHYSTTDVDPELAPQSNAPEPKGRVLFARSPESFSQWSLRLCGQGERGG